MPRAKPRPASRPRAELAEPRATAAGDLDALLARIVADADVDNRVRVWASRLLAGDEARPAGDVVKVEKKQPQK